MIAVFKTWKPTPLQGLVLRHYVPKFVVFSTSMMVSGHLSIVSGISFPS